MTDVLDVLDRHGIEVTPAPDGFEASLETYRIQAINPSTKEDKEFLEVEVATREGQAQVPAGDAIVWCDQMASDLIVVLLEPQSQWGLAPLPDFAHLLRVGSDYPIRRIVGVPD